MVGLVSDLALHGLVKGVCSWNILNPYLPFVWPTLPLNYPKGAWIGQTLAFGCIPIPPGYKSNQKEYLNEPAAWLLTKILSGWVIQKVPGV